MASGTGGLTSTLFQRTCVTVEATTKQSAVVSEDTHTGGIELTTH